jgi:hypothetical protein
MATIHNTVLVPSKLELLTDWLPSRPWYARAGGPPRLSAAGGFRLDDPAGEVGIEFIVVVDHAGQDHAGQDRAGQNRAGQDHVGVGHDAGEPAVTYHVPLTYRASPCPGAEAGFVGTMEHGVLGTRHVYDGAYDPVLLAQLVALLQGRAEPQAQRLSDTPDPTVRVCRVAVPELVATRFTVTDGPASTRVTAAAAGAPVSLALSLVRVLTATPDGPGPEAAGPAGQDGHVHIPWRGPDGTASGGVVVTATPTPTRG